MSAAVPPLDSILLRLTPTLERDYARRGVFPALRMSKARVFKGSQAVLVLTPDEAEAALEDAHARRQIVTRGDKTAYKAHARAIEAAKEEARDRLSAFAAKSIVNVYTNDCRELWCGTMEQLIAHGIVGVPSSPWPNEASGRAWLYAEDARGFKTNISRYSVIWPGLYEARIWIPNRAREHIESEASKDSKAAQLGLQLMPRSADDFRKGVLRRMRSAISFELSIASESTKLHGYTLTEDGASAVHAAFDEIVEAIVNAEVRFDAARHAEIAQGYRAQVAGGDTGFQTRLAQLVAPKGACVLQGEAP